MVLHKDSFAENEFAVKGKELPIQSSNKSCIRSLVQKERQQIQKNNLTKKETATMATMVATMTAAIEATATMTAATSCHQKKANPRRHCEKLDKVADKASQKPHNVDTSNGHVVACISKGTTNRLCQEFHVNRVLSGEGDHVTCDAFQEQHLLSDVAMCYQKQVLCQGDWLGFILCETVLYCTHPK